MTLNDEKKIKDADVYHVDAEDNVENMDGSVDKNGNVEFETTHFFYVCNLCREAEKNVKVTIQHLDNTTGKEIYSADERTILVGGKINDYTKAQNWEVSKVEVNDVVVTNHEKIEVAQDSYDKSVFINQSVMITSRDRHLFMIIQLRLVIKMGHIIHLIC